MKSGEQRVTVFHLRPLRTDGPLAKQPPAANAIPPAHVGSPPIAQRDTGRGRGRAVWEVELVAFEAFVDTTQHDRVFAK